MYTDPDLRNRKKIFFKIKRILKNKIFKYKNYINLITRNALAFNSGISIESAEETLIMLLKKLQLNEGLAYLRFGDGDVNILNGGKDRCQINSSELMRDHRLAFSLYGSNVIKALPLHSEKFGKDKYMGVGEHLWDNDYASRMLIGSFEYFVGQKIWSPVPLHYCMVYVPELAKNFFVELGLHEPIFVGGIHNDPDLLRITFGAKDIVETPSFNAYEKVDEILESILRLIDSRQRNYEVVLFASGMLSRVLISKVYERYKSIYLFDLGSIVELFRGESSWTWVKKSKKGPEYWNEFINDVHERRVNIMKQRNEILLDKIGDR